MPDPEYYDDRGIPFDIFLCRLRSTNWVLPPTLLPPTLDLAAFLSILADFVDQVECDIYESGN